ncbi:hypothetical protein H920_00811 [Fukomys damarensis]|uniref:Uncharacterized protein n=1 Tax=Fukomys damarensis TaxID=885580 RepID=A0A091E380_FUKDA|nr:hypothetical protein H920_00811 [Fukomys damarensis]
MLLLISDEKPALKTEHLSPPISGDFHFSGGPELMFRQVQAPVLPRHSDRTHSECSHYEDLEEPEPEKVSSEVRCQWVIAKCTVHSARVSFTFIRLLNNTRKCLSSSSQSYSLQALTTQAPPSTYPEPKRKTH